MLGKTALNHRLAKIIVESTSRAIKHIVNKSTPAKHERNLCATLFGNFYNSKNVLGNEWTNILRIFCTRIRHGKIFQHFLGMPSGAWALFLHDSIEMDFLDEKHDQISINHAHALIRIAATEGEYANLLREGYLPPPVNILTIDDSNHSSPVEKAPP